MSMPMPPPTNYITQYNATNLNVFQTAPGDPAMLAQQQPLSYNAMFNSQMFTHQLSQQNGVPPGQAKPAQSFNNNGGHQRHQQHQHQQHQPQSMRKQAGSDNKDAPDGSAK